MKNTEYRYRLQIPIPTQLYFRVFFEFDEGGMERFRLDIANAIGSTVHSKLDYCNSLYYIPYCQLNIRLQQIQNCLARAVCTIVGLVAFS